MNIALIFAGGTGQRMNSKTRPKQFLELHGKPIIIYTIEAFERHPRIDGIVIACLEPWIPYLQNLLKRFGITKVSAIVPGGANGQESIYNGLAKASELYPSESVVLVHDGVRPLVNGETISACINKTLEAGSAITVVPAIETVVRTEDGVITEIIDRHTCSMARAPQAFILGELVAAHEQAKAEGLDDFIDSASLMRHYGHPLHVVEGTPENIKITTPSDFYEFRALVDALEDSQIFGID